MIFFPSLTSAWALAPTQPFAKCVMAFVCSSVKWAQKLSLPCWAEGCSVLWEVLACAPCSWNPSSHLDACPSLFNCVLPLEPLQVLPHSIKHPFLPLFLPLRALQGLSIALDVQVEAPLHRYALLKHPGCLPPPPLHSAVHDLLASALSVLCLPQHPSLG